MTQIKIKRVYEAPDAADGYRVLVDRLWPRGIKKEHLKSDVWEKDITPSAKLRKWFHENTTEHWEDFANIYRTELEGSDAVRQFMERIKTYDTVTLLYWHQKIPYSNPRAHPSTVSFGSHGLTNDILLFQFFHTGSGKILFHEVPTLFVRQSIGTEERGK